MELQNAEKVGGGRGWRGGGGAGPKQHESNESLLLLCN